MTQPPKDLNGPLALLVVETPSEPANIYLCPATRLETQRLKLGAYRKSHLSFHALENHRVLETGPFPLTLPPLLQVKGTAKFYNSIEEAACQFDHMTSATDAVEMLEGAIDTLRQRAAQVMHRGEDPNEVLTKHLLINPIPLEGE